MKELKSALRSALFRLKVKSGKPRSILVQTATKGNHRTVYTLRAQGSPKLTYRHCFQFFVLLLLFTTTVVACLEPKVTIIVFSLQYKAP